MNKVIIDDHTILQVDYNKISNENVYCVVGGGDILLIHNENKCQGGDFCMYHLTRCCITNSGPVWDKDKSLKQLIKKNIIAGRDVLEFDCFRDFCEWFVHQDVC